MLFDFRAWIVPETSKLEKWKAYPKEKAIRACRARLVDDAEAMLAEWRKATAEDVDIGETATLPILLTALAPIQAPPDVTQVKSTSPFVEVAINDRIVRLRTIRTAIRCQAVFFSTNVHDTKSFIDQFQAYLDDDMKRRIDVAYKINGHDITSYKMTVLDNTLFPDNITSEAKNIDIVSIDCVLTHEDNRAVLTSQPARNGGFFYDTHHKLSFAAGGPWTNLIFNGEVSPLVSEQSIREQQQKYGGRDDPQYKIRVLGQFPELTDEFLLSPRQADGAYVGTSLFDNDHDNFGYVIAVDVGGGVMRDDSTIGVAKVWGSAQFGENSRRAELIDIPLCKNTDEITELFGKINELLLTYPNATLVLDDNGAGKGLGQLLKAHAIYYTAVYWGGACFKNENRKQFFNKRAQAYGSRNYADAVMVAAGASGIWEQLELNRIALPTLINLIQLEQEYK